MKEGLNEVDLSVLKVRALVKYVRYSLTRLKKFKICVKKQKEESKSHVVLLLYV